MATPILVASYMASATTTDNSNLTTASFTPNNGEILVVKAACDNDASPTIGLATGGGLTYTSRIDLHTGSRCPIRLFTAPVTGSPGSMAVTVAFSGGIGRHSIIVERWANAQLAGTPAVASDFVSGAPTLDITTVANGSVVSWVSADWNATIPGTPTYESGAVLTGMDDVSPSNYVAYYLYQNTDTAGTQSFGITSPGGQQATMGGIEIQGVSENVVFDSVGPNSGGAGTFASSVNWSHTCTGRDRFLVVGMALGSGPDTGKTLTATYNGISMTSAALVHTNNQNSGYVQLFYLVNPASGTHTVNVTASSSADLIGGSISFVGVNQSTPTSGLQTNYGESTTPGITVTSKAGDMVVTTVANGSNISSSNQTTRWLNNFSSGTGASNAAQATAVGASSVYTAYTVASDWWGIIGLNILATGTSAPTDPAVPIAWLSI